MIKISSLSLTNAGQVFSGQEPPSFLAITPSPLLTCERPVDYELHAALVNNGALVTGKISTRITCACGRCLVLREISVANLEVCHFYENPLPSEIDLTTDLREDILINFPQNYLCRENCRGLCAHCGADLNREKCACGTIEKENPAWKELDKLALSTSKSGRI